MLRAQKLWRSLTSGLSVKWIVAYYGPFGTLRWLQRSLLYHVWLHLSPSGRRDLMFDEIHSVETEGIVEPRDLGLVNHPASLSDAVHYAPSRPQRLTYLLANLRIDYRQFTFVDIGAGKGRALLIAAQFPFKRIVGVEFSPGLVATARRNVEVYVRSLKTPADMEVICADASDYELPSDNIVVYLFNPFNGPTFSGFLARLERSLRENPRTIYLVYWSPMSEPVLARCGLFKKLGGRRDQFAIYRTVESL